MHELSLCQSAVEIIQRQAEQHDVKRVTAVWLEIGALLPIYWASGCWYTSDLP